MRRCFRYVCKVQIPNLRSCLDVHGNFTTSPNRLALRVVVLSIVDLALEGSFRFSFRFGSDTLSDTHDRTVKIHKGSGILTQNQLQFLSCNLGMENLSHLWHLYGYVPLIFSMATCHELFQTYQTWQLLPSSSAWMTGWMLTFKMTDFITPST